MDAAALPTQMTPLARELHVAISAMEPRGLRRSEAHALRSRLLALRAKLQDAADTLSGVSSMEALRAVLCRIISTLDTLPSPDLPRRVALRGWRRLRKSLLRVYGAWSRELAAWDIHIPSLRPFNLTRNLFHAGWATVAALILGLYPHPLVLLGCITPVFVWAWTMEWLRRRIPSLNKALMKAFAPVAHPHEHHRVNSATWYTTALFSLALADIPTASMVGLLVLGYADPAAAIVGRRFGRTPLINGRSLEGSLAFAAVGTAVAFTVLASIGDLPLAIAMAAAAAGGTVGAAAELLSRKVDDNLSVPLAAALAAQGVFLLFA